MGGSSSTHSARDWLKLTELQTGLRMLGQEAEGRDHVRRACATLQQLSRKLSHLFLTAKREILKTITPSSRRVGDDSTQGNSKRNDHLGWRTSWNNTPRPWNRQPRPLRLLRINPRGLTCETLQMNTGSVTQAGTEPAEEATNHSNHGRRSASP